MFEWPDYHTDVQSHDCIDTLAEPEESDFAQDFTFGGAYAPVRHFTHQVFHLLEDSDMCES